MSKFEKIEKTNIPEKKLTPEQEKEVEELNREINPLFS